MSLSLLDYATEFAFRVFPDGCEYDDLAMEAVTVTRRGPDRWAVLIRGRCFDADGHGTYEHIPSERTDEFLERYRHSRDDAVRIAREIVAPAWRGTSTTRASGPQQPR